MGNRTSGEQQSRRRPNRRADPQGGAGCPSSKRYGDTDAERLVRPAVPQTERDARNFIASRYGRDVREVQVRVDFAWTAVALAQSKPSQANVDQLAQQSHDTIDAIRGDFIGCWTNHSGTLQDVQMLLNSDAGEVKNAMGALVAYCGTPNAATLASFTSQYQQARADWDRDVRVIWAIAREKKPPTF